MSDELPEKWPLRPSHSACVAHGLCLALVDVARDEGAKMSRRGYLQLMGVATAAELFTNEVAHWFHSRMGDDHELLEALEERYEAETVENN